MADLLEEKIIHFEDNNEDKNEEVNEEAALIICSDEIQNLDGNPNGDNVFKNELENEVIIHEVEDEGRPSRILVDGNFSVSLDKYLRTMSRNPVQITFEATANEESRFPANNTNRGLFIVPPCPMPAIINESEKKTSDHNDDEPYLMDEKENKDRTQGKSIWITGRLKLKGDSHTKLVPD